MKRGLVLLALWGGIAASASAAGGDRLARGEQVYARCAACHAIEQHRTGPAHCGLFGRKAGSAPGYEHYSAALKGSGIVWTDQTLARFLASPMTVVPGTNMTYLGVQDAGERADLVAWLRHATQAGKRCQLRQ